MHVSSFRLPPIFRICFTALFAENYPPRSSHVKVKFHLHADARVFSSSSIFSFHHATALQLLNSTTPRIKTAIISFTPSQTELSIIPIFYPFPKFSRLLKVRYHNCISKCLQCFNQLHGTFLTLHH